MIKRQFSISRFYQFIKWAMIAIAVVFLVMSLGRFHSSKVTYPSEQATYCNAYLNPLNDYVRFLDCQKKFMADWSRTEVEAENYLFLAITIPILFFGIVGAYRYIFPKK